MVKWFLILFVFLSYHSHAQPPKMTLKLGKGNRLALILIPGGSFLMGSGISATDIAARFGGSPDIYDDEFPRHKVVLDSFWMSKFEITRGQFATFVKKTGYKSSADTAGWAYFFNGKIWEQRNGINWNNTGFAQDENHPATYISWYDAQAFCKWLSGKSGYNCTLPKEEQWEYAARGGYQTNYFWGDAPAGGDGYANAADLTLKVAFPGKNTFPWTDSFLYTAPVGSFLPNPFGLYDMTGNVWEWCQDVYVANAYDTTVLVTATANDKHTLRGGCWLNDPGGCRLSDRNGWPQPTDSYGGYGFRIVVAPRVRK